jgi:putative lipoprotein
VKKGTDLDLENLRDGSCFRRRSVPFFTLVLAFAGACAAPAGPGRVTGTATYRERIAVPEGAVLRVTLLDVSLVDAPERVIAERELRSADQVPIPFALEFARNEIARERRYGLRAALLGPDGRALFATPAAVPVLTHGAPDAVELRLARPAPPAGPRVLAYDCHGLSFRVELTGERARLLLPGRSLVLPKAPAASGAKYSDGDDAFWSRGEEASLVLGGEEHAGCRLRARPVP